MNNLKIKQLQSSELQHLIDLQEEIFKDEKNKEKILNSPIKVLESYFKEKGFILGIYDNNELIGFTRVWFPDFEELSDSYKEILKINSNEQIGKTAFFRGSCIKKEYRGQKLQKRLYENAIEVLKYLGFQYITAKIKINNIPSLKNVSDLGFRNEGIVIKNNTEYYLLIKKL